MLGAMSDTNYNYSSGVLPRSNFPKIASEIAISIISIPMFLILVCCINSRSRKYLDRVSFRLAATSLCCLLIIMTMVLLRATYGVRCDVVAGVYLFFSQLTSTLLLCVGVNLVLVMIYGKNGNALEKFYYIGSVGYCLLPTLPPLLAGMFRPGRTNSTCASIAANKSDYLGWWIAIVIIFPSLIIVGEFLAFARLMIYLWKSKVFDRSFMQRQRRTWISSTRLQPATSEFSADNSPTEVSSPASSTSEDKGDVTRYRWIVLRISLYPLVSVITLTLIMAGRRSLHFTYPGQEKMDWEIPLLVAAGLLRLVLHSLLVSFDPALVRGTSVFFVSKVDPAERPRNQNRSRNTRREEPPLDIVFASFGSIEFAHDKTLDQSLEGEKEIEHDCDVISRSQTPLHSPIPVPPPVRVVSTSPPRGFGHLDLDLEVGRDGRGLRPLSFGWIELEKGISEEGEEILKQI